MKKFLAYYILLLTFIILSFDTPKEKIVYKANTFFGCEHANTTSVSKEEFDKLMSKRLCAKDSANNILPVHKFEIIYAERGLYQDSSGLPIIHTDYSSSVCSGDSIPQAWINVFKERAYKGDTIFFDQVIARSVGNKLVPSKSVTIIIK